MREAGLSWLLPRRIHRTPAQLVLAALMIRQTSHRRVRRPRPWQCGHWHPSLNLANAIGTQAALRCDSRRGRTRVNGAAERAESATGATPGSLLDGATVRPPPELLKSGASRLRPRSGPNPATGDPAASLPPRRGKPKGGLAFGAMPFANADPRRSTTVAGQATLQARSSGRCSSISARNLTEIQVRDEAVIGTAI